MRLSQGNQVPNRPGDNVAVPLEIAFASLVWLRGHGQCPARLKAFRQGSQWFWIRLLPSVTSVYSGPLFRCLHGDRKCCGTSVVTLDLPLCRAEDVNVSPGAICLSDAFGKSEADLIFEV